MEEDFKYCKLCLVTDVKMFSLNTSSICEAYSQLLQVVPEDHKQFVCYICVNLLRKYQEFHSKCVTALNLLSSIHKDQSKVTKESIVKIDRKFYNLHYKLSTSQFTNQECIQEKDCLITEETTFIDEIKTEIDTELDRPDNDSDFEGADKEFNNKRTVTEDAINTEPSDYVPDKITNNVKKKMKKRKIETNRMKFRTKDKLSDIKHEPIDSSDLDDEPLSKRALRTRKENSEDLNKEIKPAKKKTGPKFDESYFEDYATVVLLTPEEAKKEVLLRKESNNYKNCEYKCDLCFRGYEVKTTFDNHMKKHSLEYGSWECEYCHLRFPEKKFLYKHQFSCHKRKFYCKICPYVCFCNHQAKTHISLHKGKKYPCKECGEIFSMPNSLLMHGRVKHGARCACAHCGAVLRSQRGLYAHCLLLHRQDSTELSGPECKECDVRFATETAYKRHLVLSSKHTVSNGCEYCGETFCTEEDLKSHLKMHSRKQMNRGHYPKLPAACSICEKWLTNRSEYKTHMRSDHPQSAAAKSIDAEDQMQCVCELCGMAFKKQCFLQYHQRKHTGERPYECHCGATFRFPGALSTHRATHAPTRDHKCHLCHKLFVYRSALNKHLKAHLGIRPHKCTFCDKSFPNPSDVKVHMKYVHYKVPWPKRDRTKRSAKEGSV